MDNNKRAAGLTGSTLRSFAMLRLDQTRLLIPQAEVRVLELNMDMIWDAPPSGGVGWIRFNEQQYPVYSLSPAMETLDTVPADREICALLEADGRMFGLLCSEVSLIKAGQLKLQAMPAAMATPDSPIEQLAIHEEKLACLSSAAKIFAHLPPMENDQ